jgi:hypothetical protein
MERYIDKINPELSYTPEKRALEYKFVKTTLNEVEKLNISKEDKKNVMNIWFDHILEYEKIYSEYNKNKKDAIFYILSIIN